MSSTDDTKPQTPASPLDDFFDADTEPEPPAATWVRDSRSKPGSAIPDLGASPAFLVAGSVAIAAIVYLSLRGPGAHHAWAALLFLLVGAFALVSASANWESFDRSLRFRTLAGILGANRAKFVHRLMGCALLMTAFLIFSGLVEWPFAAENAIQEEVPDPPAKSVVGPSAETKPDSENP